MPPSHKLFREIGNHIDIYEIPDKGSDEAYYLNSLNKKTKNRALLTVQNITNYLGLSLKHFKR